MKTKYFYSTLLCCAAFAATAAANAANGTTEDRLAASLLKSKTPCVVNIKFGGHVGQDINDCFTHRVLGENTEELVAGAYIVRFTNVISNRFDSTTFKRLYADLYKDFTKPVSCRRFSVSC